jgi:Asp-tRNA(Asn)/Glu-tRNA(Gln) amidotransferase C subunit
MTTPVSLDSLRRSAQVAGFDWSDAELEAIRGAVERALESLARLERLPLGDVEPTTQYRVL